jgi:hypothetical protein
MPDPPPAGFHLKEGFLAAIEALARRGTQE